MNEGNDVLHLESLVLCAANPHPPKEITKTVVEIYDIFQGVVHYT